MVEELFNACSELGEELESESFLENEIAMVVEATEKIFYTDEEEVVVYEELRKSAVGVESAILSIADNEMRDMYEDILWKARELSLIDGGQ